MAASYNDWKKRAHAHLAEGRAIDALSCFRKAARMQPRAREPFSGIAESLWRLGKLHEAIAAWREAATRMPNYLPTWQALAEAATFVGDDALALQAATRILATSPNDARARFIDASALLADAAQPGTQCDATQLDAACSTLAGLVETAPAIVRTPHMAQALARALSKCAADSCLSLRRALAAFADTMALDLVAQVASF
ncbi:MAG TPA: hypothetical protein VIH15_10840, partial [Casimicrobiaceae bacterium]